MLPTTIIRIAKRMIRIHGGTMTIHHHTHIHGITTIRIVFSHHHHSTTAIQSPLATTTTHHPHIHPTIGMTRCKSIHKGLSEGIGGGSGDTGHVGWFFLLGGSSRSIPTTTVIDIIRPRHLRTTTCKFFNSCIESGGIKVFGEGEAGGGEIMVVVVGGSSIAEQ